MKERILIFGASDHARLVIDTLERQNKYEIEGLVDPNFEKGVLVQGHKVLGSEKDLIEFVANGLKSGFIAIGDNFIREKVRNIILEHIPDFEFIKAIHPSSIVSPKAKLSNGVLVLPGAIVNCGAEIGEHCIVHTGAIIEHDVKMEDFSSTSPRVTLGGSVKLGYRSFLGIGAVVLHGREIREDTIVGAGSVVTKNLDGLSVYYGVAAKFVRSRKKNEPYY